MLELKNITFKVEGENGKKTILSNINLYINTNNLKSRRNYNNSLIRLAGQAQMLHKLSAVPLIPDTVYACH